ncbi:MAG: ATP dependent DNA ligase domain-containing protein [Podila humilis]|nr:MAG: ATP dependent DNA ligase domain-containing protein [Podila humilis]
MPDTPESGPAKFPAGSAQSTTTTRAPMPDDDDPSVPSPRFHDLVMLLEDISKRKSEKRELLHQYFRDWRARGYGSLYPVIRLLLPELDRYRGRYGLREQKMAELYVACLKISPTSDAAYKLKNWKEGLRDSAGDFSLVAAEIIATRSLVTHSQGQTIRDVNALLTRLSKKDAENKGIFEILIKNYTSLENKWIVRIINRNLKIGMSESSVLPAYHQDALELFNVCSDLRKTVLDCADPTIRISTSSVTLNHPFKPMLSKRLHTAKEILDGMGDEVFWIEEKLDGERIQIHKDGENYRYWSRNSTEFTHLYGATPREGSLTPFIHPLINSKAHSLILDGEMVEYDPATKQILPFGKVKTAGGNHSVDEHKTRPCMFVFDVLFMNGTSIIDQPLRDRWGMLPYLLPKEAEGRIEILKHDEGSTENHIIEALDAAVLERKEGVIIKNPTSRYVANGRDKEWIKLKPEYVDGVFDSLDVLIVGGYYGQGARGGQNKIASYLCAVVDNIGRSPSGKKLTSFCKFGTGFSFDQMDNFNKRLGPHWKEYKNYREDPWVDIIDNAKMRPDVIIDPANSIVVEIKAAEIISNSTSYASEYTLRFPRFLRIREDKDAESCMTLSEVHRMYRDYKGKLSTKSAEGFRHESSKKKKKPTGPRKSTQAHLLHTIVGTDTSRVKQVENLFEGQIFYVIRGDKEQDKPELEIKIKEYGGVQSQSYQMENTLVVAGHDGVDLVGLKKRGDRDIVLPTWIRDCIREKRRLPLNPKYMYFATEKTVKQFRLIMDKWYDSYTEPLTSDGLLEILESIPTREQDIQMKRERNAEAQRVSKVRRLNNLEDQPDHDYLQAAAVKNEDVVMESSDLDPERYRARRIVTEITQRYFGHDDGASHGPLGMFQGYKVFLVYPPKPEQYLASVGLQRAVELTEARSGDKSSLVSMFDVFSQTIDLWEQNKDKDMEKRMREHNLLNRGWKHAQGNSDEDEDEQEDWHYVFESVQRDRDLNTLLQTLSNHQLCRNSLDMTAVILEFHGAEVVPEEECTIEHCLRLFRTTSHNDASFKKEDAPTKVCILFDDMYMDSLEQWKRATQTASLLFGHTRDTLSRPRPRLVTSEWVSRSEQVGYVVPEEGHYPGDS